MLPSRPPGVPVLRRAGLHGRPRADPAPRHASSPPPAAGPPPSVGPGPAPPTGRARYLRPALDSAALLFLGGARVAPGKPLTRPSVARTPRSQGSDPGVDLGMQTGSQDAGSRHHLSPRLRPWRRGPSGSPTDQKGADPSLAQGNHSQRKRKLLIPFKEAEIQNIY
ncbi:hypothetical protein R6Z07F_010666 [Ovis aries]